MNDTGNSFGSNPASLKGKLQTLEVLPSNSESNQEHLKLAQQPQKIGADSQKWKRYTWVSAHHENCWCQEEPQQWTCQNRRRNVILRSFRKRHFNFQKAENSRIQQQITSLKGEKTALQQQLLGLQRRITELEMQVGSEAQWSLTLSWYYFINKSRELLKSWGKTQFCLTKLEVVLLPPYFFTGSYSQHIIRQFFKEYLGELSG